MKITKKQLKSLIESTISEAFSKEEDLLLEANKRVRDAMSAMRRLTKATHNPQRRERYSDAYDKLSDAEILLEKDDYDSFLDEDKQWKLQRNNLNH